MLILALLALGLYSAAYAITKQCVNMAGGTEKKLEISFGLKFLGICQIYFVAGVLHISGLCRVHHIFLYFS
jgi:hypothetical protein